MTRFLRANGVRLACAVVVAALAACGSGTRRATITITATPSPSVMAQRWSNQVLWGVHAPALPQEGVTAQTAIQTLESTTGRLFELDRQFHRWDVAFPTAYDKWSSGQGRTLVLSWSGITQAGEPVLWKDIASGRYDETHLKPRARALRGFREPLFFAFEHEPEVRIKTNGTPEEFVAAWRHMVDVFRAEGVRNVEWVWIVIDYSFWTGAAARYYPGDAYVDWIGADGYNWYQCRADNVAPWRSWKQIFDPVRTFGQAHGKPVMVAEFGSVEDPAVPDRKAQWIQDARTTLQQPEWERFRAVIYYNRRDAYAPTGRDCDWRVTTSTSALSAYVGMARDAYF